ncbi:uncharacterized protein LOC120486187 [Pimephales promelas]|uniref:uncharacterized protein LOC120486187 n=1 Tax=Pimephales promelas TaxID=90988 RepID=UPI00195575CD|nr:uncharacterized protein LOC120486187 [Pimephales promelas]
MTLIRTQEITKVLVEHLKKFATQFSLPGCRQNIASDADWLKANLGPFTTLANYSDLKELNVSGVAALETLSPDQKAELLLDPSTGALENVTVVKEVLSSILKSPDENQLEKFFEKFVEVSKEENVTYITNVEVRDTMLNLTLTALAPKFPLFQTSDYELWFQINLVVLLASFRPSVLVVIPTNLTCDSYSAILKGLETALAVLPSGLKAELKSSVDQLVQSQGEDCTPPRPVGFCNETLVDENRLCQDVNRGQLEAQRLSENSSAGLCDFNISDYACSSVASSLSSDDIFTLLTCKVPSGTSTETWKLFFLKVAGVLEDALSKFSNMTLPNGQPQSHVLDAIGEVKVNNFSAAQLTDAGFVAAWFQDRLRPFLSAVSRDFLSCLSSKNFSCDTYQVVVQALGRQASLMAEEQKRAVFTQFIQRFLSRDDLKDPACLSKTTSSADWLEKNIGNFSSYADLEDLKSLNGNFSSLASLALLTPTQVAQLTLSSGVLNNTNQISAVFDRLEEGDAFQNVEEFLTALSAAPETPDITPAARDVMMNRTFIIIRSKIQEFEASVWVTWFTVKLIPILPSFTPEMLVTVTANISCTNYHVIVKGLGSVFHEMTLIRTQEITKVLVEHLKKFATQFSLPGCRQNIASDADWLKANLGPFTTLANYSDLKELNVSGVAALETLSPDQKAELLLDPSTGALENVTVVKEVLSSILKSPDENQLEKFFEKFVEVSKEENVTYITNVEVRDTMLNLTLTALAPKFPLFQTSDYELWFQINLVVLLASFRPSVLVVIPTNLTCDSYSAILKGLETALAVLPSGLKAELKSSVDQLVQSQGEDCTPPRPVGFCNETLVDENRLCQDVNRGQLEAQRLSENSSAGLCDFNISDYACSSVASSLSSDDIFTLLTCKVPSGTSTETWKLFFLKVAGVLEDALSKFSNMTLPNGQPQSHVLDAIGEVKVNNFSAAQLTDAGFVAAWFQDRLRPFLSAVSRDFLSCLSSKNFSCDTYQVVVQALGRQASLMAEEQKRAVFTQFIQRFLSRDDLKDPACLSKTTSSADWLEKNIGNFSSYADLEDLKSLNGNFSSLASLALLTPTQVAQLTLSSGVLNNTNQISAVFDRLEEGDAFQNVEEFLTALSAAPETPDITPAARDVMMNRTFIIIRSKIQEFEASVWVTWFTVKLIPILPSFTPEMLVTVTANISCTNYHVIVKGLGSVFHEMTLIRTQEITKVLVEHLKKFATQFSLPGCRQNIASDADWLKANLGPFTTLANYSDLKELNVSGVAALETLSPDQKAELLLDPSTGALENVTVVKEVLSSILKSPDENQLEKFFEKFVEVSKEENVTYITNVEVRDTMLNLTLTALAPKFPLFQTSDYELWFQINLVVLLASFRPSVLVVIPTNLTCDSYSAILKGLETALAVLPSGLKAELKSSVDQLVQSQGEDCTPPRPVGFCNETLVDENRLCQDVNRGQLEAQRLSENSSAGLCDFNISDYACSSVASSLSSDDIFTLLTCKVPSGTSTETWKLFFLKVAGVLEDALSKFSNMTLPNGQPQSHVLDAIGEVKVNNFSAAQLTDAGFVAAWFQDRLRPFLSAVSRDFLSCLSSKNFSCDTYQVVVQALGRQASLMAEEQKRAVFTQFIQRFLSRDDLKDPACLSKTTSSADWLEKNIGNFSSYADLEDLKSLNGNFSSLASLALLTLPK